MQMQTSLAAHNPCLIYFRSDDTVADIERTCAKRGEEWRNYVVSALEQTAYAQSHNLTGYVGIMEMLRRYGEVSNRAAQLWRFPKLVLPSDPASYADRDKTILEWVLDAKE
jgi:hypothetical protein